MRENGAARRPERGREERNHVPQTKTPDNTGGWALLALNRHVQFRVLLSVSTSSTLASHSNVEGMRCRLDTWPRLQKMFILIFERSPSRRGSGMGLRPAADAAACYEQTR